MIALLKPNVYVVAFAVFCAINAACAWGSGFSFLPAEFQSDDFLFSGFTWQSISFGLTAVAMFTLAFFAKKFPRLLVLVLSVAAYLAACLFALYCVFQNTLFYECAVISGICLGFANMGILSVWIMFFSSWGMEKGTTSLIVGTFYAALLYALFSFLPVEASGFVIPPVLVPATGAVLLVGLRRMDTDQPMFRERPADHRENYKQGLKGYWRTTLCLGALAACSGVMRAYGLLVPTAEVQLNLVSMLTLLLTMLFIILITRKRDINLNILTIYQFCFPFLVTGFLVVPIFGPPAAFPFSIFVYNIFSVATVFMHIQCLQAAHNLGLNPVISYSAIGGFAYLVHNIAFMCSRYVEAKSIYTEVALLFVCLVGLYMLSFMFFLAQKGAFLSVISRRFSTESIEIFSMKKRSEEGELADIASPLIVSEAQKDTIKDQVSKQCLIMQRKYGLSARETEIVELLARGDTATQIAKDLFVTESTVRTHIRRVYAKTGVHKKQELLNLMKEVSA